MASNPTISLLDKYPHLRLLAKRRVEDVTKHGESRVNHEGVCDGGRISLLGPGVGTRSSPPIVLPPTVPRTRVVAEELFAASVAADDDQWLQFQVEADVPAREQIDSLKLWLVANRPSTIARSAGVGWIAVKFKDKGKKVMEAKAAWDRYEGEKTMEVVNKLATEFHVMGGKWMCHLPSGLIDDVWAKLATALMCGGLGPSVYMVKVSPVEDIDPNLARGEHVICVYNTDYKDTEQVMRVENLMRSAGVATILNYKPDIFSALGIYRNNKWGFRPTIYSSKVMMMEGRSRVETVGTGKWYYNSSKGLLYPSSSSMREEKTGISRTGVRDGEKKDDSGIAVKKIIDETKLAAGPVGIPGFRLESMDKMKNMQDRAPLNSSMESMDKMKNMQDRAPLNPTNTGLNMFPMESLDKMKSKDNAGGGDLLANKENTGKKSSWSHRLTAKKNCDIGNEFKKEVKVKDAKHEAKANPPEADARKPLSKSWSHRLAAKRGDDAHSENESKPGEGLIGEGGSKIEVSKDSGQEDLKENQHSASVDQVAVKQDPNSANVKKPAWLKKLEEMKMKSLDDMKTG